MSRKTDEELLEEIKKRTEEKKAKKKELEEENSDDVPEIEPKEETEQTQPQIVEREINLALINDKLNFIISKLQ